MGKRCHNQGELCISVAKRCTGIVVFLNSYQLYNSGGKKANRLTVWIIILGLVYNYNAVVVATTGIPTTVKCWL